MYVWVSTNSAILTPDGLVAHKETHLSIFIKWRMKMTKVAVIQEAPVFLDKEKTIKKAVALIDKTAASNAKLIVFPETFIPGYPDWIWRLKPANDEELTEEIHAQLLANSINLKTDDLKPLCDSAKKHQVTIVCNINERDFAHSQTTIYNTNVIIGC
ncbi:uncharacterized protein METZ01_LOCUS397173, partial [marine metagenome]